MDKCFLMVGDIANVWMPDDRTDAVGATCVLDLPLSLKCYALHRCPKLPSNTMILPLSVTNGISSTLMLCHTTLFYSDNTFFLHYSALIYNDVVPINPTTTVIIPYSLTIMVCATSVLSRKALLCSENSFTLKTRALRFR